MVHGTIGPVRVGERHEYAAFSVSDDRVRAVVRFEDAVIEFSADYVQGRVVQYAIVDCGLDGRLPPQVCAVVTMNVEPGR